MNKGIERVASYHVLKLYEGFFDLFNLDKIKLNTQNLLNHLKEHLIGLVLKRVQLSKTTMDEF